MIRVLQKAIDLLISKNFFQRVVKELMQHVDLKKKHELRSENTTNRFERIAKDY
jgi:histone H3/H4